MERSRRNMISRISGYWPRFASRAVAPAQPQEPDIHGQTHSQSRAAGRRSRHAFPAGDQGHSEGDADRRRPADPSVCRGRGARGGDRAFHFRDRPQQGGHRGSFRHKLRARGHPQAAWKAGRICGLDGRSSRRPGATSFTRQQAPLGLGHAVWCAREIVGAEPFAVLLPDMVTRSGARGGRCLAQCVAAYERHGGNVIAVEEVSAAETHQYGIVGVGVDHGATFEITHMVEKPKPGTAPSNLIISGRYILQPEIFQILEADREGRGGRDSVDRRHDPACRHPVLPWSAFRRPHL